MTQKIDKSTKEKKEWLFLALLGLLILGIHTLRIFNDSISGDEGYTLSLIKMSIPELLRATGGDVHPPFYYIFCKVFALLTGPSAYAGKLFSWLAIAFVVLLGITYIQKEFGKKAALLFMVLSTFTKNAIEMVVEIRMYTWGLLFVTLAALFAYEILKKDAWYKWLGLVICGLASAYTHYYALIAVTFVYLCLFAFYLLRNREKLAVSLGKCFLWGMLTVIGYLPWLFVLLKQFGTVSNDFWIPYVDIKDNIQFLFGEDRFGRVLRTILYVSAFLFLLSKKGFTIIKRVKLSKLQEGEGTEQFLHITWEFPNQWTEKQILVLMCGIATIGTILVGTGLSLLLRPMYLPRYVYPAWGLAALAFGISFDVWSEKRRYAWLLAAVILLFGMKHFVGVYTTEQNYLTEEAKEFFAENLQEGDVIVTNHGMLSWTVLRYYLPETEIAFVDSFEWETHTYERIWFLSQGEEINEKLLEAQADGGELRLLGESGIGRYYYNLYELIP